MQTIIRGAVSASASFGIWVACVHAADPGHDGNEPCTWANKSLLVAKVVKVARDQSATKHYGLQDYVTIDPKMTLAGSFDCAGAGLMSVPIVLGPFGGPLLRPPREGELVLIHLVLTNEGYLIPGFSVSYMPDDLPVWKIWGLHDETMLKVVSTIGERRREAARKEEQLGKDCVRWLKGNYPQHAEFIKPPLDKSFENRSIVLVRINSVTTEGMGKTKVSLRLIGTVAGRLDPALIGECDVWIPEMLAARRSPPANDAEMFVALDEQEGKYVVPEDELDYMPSQWAFSRLETSVEATCDRILSKIRQRAAPAAPSSDKASASAPVGRMK